MNIEIKKINLNHSFIFFLFCNIFSVIIFNYNNLNISSLLCLLLILTIGVSHGALDHLKGKKLFAILNIKSNELLSQRKQLVDKLSEAYVPLNSRYIQIAPLWPWLGKNFEVDLEINSQRWSDRHLIIYLHEGYKDWYVKYLANQIISSCQSIFTE